MASLSETVRVWLFDPLTQQMEELMATVAELQAKVDALSASLTDAKARILADVEHLRTLLADRIDPAQLDVVSSALDQLTTDVGAIDPDPAFPPVEPTP